MIKPPPIVAAAMLSVDRIALPQGRAITEADGRTLGGLAYGLEPGNRPDQWVDDAGWQPSATYLRMLHPAGPVADVWRSSSGPQLAGRCGAVRWRSDGHWLFGELQLEDDGRSADLTSLAEQAYDDVFATLAQTGYRQLLRLWNYMPSITVHSDGVERYRQFNAGRQLSFLKAGISAFDGAPAACALGSQGGPLSVSFLAGKLPALALENPRQISAYRYPDNYGQRSPSFSRAALIDAGDDRVGLLISGTSSIVGHETRHAGDVRAQTCESLNNLQAVLQVAKARTTASFDLSAMHCIVYIRDPLHLSIIRREFEEATGENSIAAASALYLQADICRSDLDVEIEAHAIAGGKIQP